MTHWDDLATRNAYEAELRAMLSRCQESAVEIATENAALRQIVREAVPWVDAHELARDKDCTEPAGLLARMRAAIEEERS